MAAFSPEMLDLLRSEREIELTTYGRTSGKPATVTIWVTTDDAGRVYVRSGYGMAGRDWPRNLAASGRGIVQVAGRELAVRARHLDDMAEARRTSAFTKRKYGDAVRVAVGDEPATPGEQASFELTPAEA
jgi:deazaflavin-dependent oxidoreductase (nitroreductase family)